MGTIVWILAAAMLILVLFAGLGCSGGSPFGRVRPPVVQTADQVMRLDRGRVADLLKRLARSPPPKATNLGAMCYEATAPPLRTEYVCPACGERTLYEDNAVWLVDFELNDCRREFAELKKTTGQAAVLDESQFCRKCSPEIEQPAIVLHLEYGDNTRHSVEGVRADDMRLLREFLTGDLMHIEQNDAETPMLQRINRIEELLGIESE